MSEEQLISQSMSACVTFILQGYTTCMTRSHFKTMGLDAPLLEHNVVQLTLNHISTEVLKLWGTHPWGAQ